VEVKGMYKFRMSIGDWSDDGHGKHEDFIISSNVPVNVVREAHFTMRDELGFSIEDICSEYEDSVIDSKITKTIMELGYEFEDIEDGEAGMYPEEMVRLWIFLLQKVDTNLELKIIKDEIPTFHFYGFDGKNRHIGQVGYGLFW
jgi:hypothetical protein